MEHVFSNAFHLFQNVSLKFLCKVHSLLCEESRRQQSLVGTECILLWRGLRFKPLLSVMLSLVRLGRDTPCWSLGRIPLCGLEGHPWQVGVLEEGEVNILHSGCGRGTEKWPMFHVCVAKSDADPTGWAFCSKRGHLWCSLLIIY